MKGCLVHKTDSVCMQSAGSAGLAWLLEHLCYHHLSAHACDYDLQQYGLTPGCFECARKEAVGCSHIFLCCTVLLCRRPPYVSAGYAALIGVLCSIVCLALGAVAAVFVQKHRMRMLKQKEQRQAEVRLVPSHQHRTSPMAAVM